MNADGGNVPRPKLNRSALWSMVFGILSIVTLVGVFLAPLAIFFGISALVQIRRSQGQEWGKGFAVVGVLTPLAWFLAWVVLGITFPGGW